MILAVAGCSSGSNPSSAPNAGTTVDPAVAAAVKNFKGTFTYWTGLTFPAAGNAIEKQRILQWGKDIGLKVEVVEVNQNDTSQKVAAALQSGSMPDALDLGYDLGKIMVANKQLAPVDATYKTIGDAHGGWLSVIDKATTDKSWGGSIYGIPYGYSGNVLFRRTDLLSKAPTTWQEFATETTSVNKPPQVYGAGLSLGNVGDGNEMTSTMQSFGGRVANDAGTTCTLNTPQVKDFLTWVTGLYQNKVIPPDSVTWNGASDNNLYLAHGAATILNTGSVYLSMVAQDPALAKETGYSQMPAGPAMTVNPITISYRAIPATTSAAGQVLADNLFSVLSQDDYTSKYMPNAIFGPVLKSQQAFPLFSTIPVYTALAALATGAGTAPAYPDVANTAFSAFENAYSTPHMIQRIVTDHLTIDAAMAEAQVNCQKIYDQYNK